jgi:F-type H+-transporting ATPase subunit delta
MNGVEVAQVTTAHPMDAALEGKVFAKIIAYQIKKSHRKYRDLPSLEVYLRIGDKQYNASVANRLQVLKRELSN